MPPECPNCLTHHEPMWPCDERGLVERLRERVREQADELQALRAISRPTYMETEIGSVPSHVPSILPDGRHTVRCICDGRAIVPGPNGAKKCPGPQSR